MTATDRDKIIAKIKKCLALAKSSNEHEAAAALRQAHKLMQAHSISDLDVEHADIQEQATRAGAILKPARWECGLATRVARAFDCAVFLQCARPAANWVFVGATPTGEIARYAFEVLFRQIRQARAHYIKTALKRCTATRTRRADLFCEGWVMTATEVVDAFAGNAAAVARAKAYLEHKHTLDKFQGHNRNAKRHLSERDHGDMIAGHQAGKHAQLHRGVNGTQTCPVLGVMS